MNGLDLLWEYKKKWQKQEIKLINQRLILTRELKAFDQKIIALDQKIAAETVANKEFFDPEENPAKEKEVLLEKKLANRIEFQNLLGKENEFFNEKKWIYNSAIETAEQAIKSLDRQTEEIINANTNLDPTTVDKLHAENNTLVDKNRKLEIHRKHLKGKVKVLTLRQANLIKSLKDQGEEKEKDTDYQK